MRIDIYADHVEEQTSHVPMELANSIIKLVTDGEITKKDLRELVAYLSVYNDYNGGRKDK